MSKYKTEEGTILDTDKAQKNWDEASDWDGKNHVSRATGSQWNHETLYISAKGRYYIVRSSQWQGSLPSAEIISNEDAARWLLNNDHKLPEDLKHLADEVSE